MKTRWWLSFILLAAMVLAACQTAAPTPAATGPAAAPQTTEPAAAPTTVIQQPQVQEETAYPAPEVAPAGTEAYPAPELPQEQPSSLYPGPQDGDEITWEQAQALILNGEVEQVTQAHSLQVTLVLKDGRSLVTMEPAIDDIIKFIQQCGDPCQDISVATE